MSILIKGLEMPEEGCKDCLLVKRGRVFDICPFLKREVNGNVERGGKPYDCPLVELPDHPAEGEIDKWWERSETVNAERSEASLCDNCDQRNDKGCCVCKYIKERSEDECEDENWYTELDDPKIAERSEE